MSQSVPQLFQLQLDAFYRSMSGKNCSPKTILAYSTDLGQFLAQVIENDLTVESVEDIHRSHDIDFLASLSERKLTGVSRVRKLAALREFFRYLVTGEWGRTKTIATGSISDFSKATTLSPPEPWISRSGNGRTTSFHSRST